MKKDNGDTIEHFNKGAAKEQPWAALSTEEEENDQMDQDRKVIGEKSCCL